MMLQYVASSQRAGPQWLTVKQWLARARVVLTAAPTWFVTLAAALTVIAESVGELLDPINPLWAPVVSAWLIRVAAVLGSAAAIIRRVTPVPSHERGILPRNEAAARQGRGTRLLSIGLVALLPALPISPTSCGGGNTSPHVVSSIIDKRDPKQHAVIVSFGGASGYVSVQVTCHKPGKPYEFFTFSEVVARHEYRPQTDLKGSHLTRVRAWCGATYSQYLTHIAGSWW